MGSGVISRDRPVQIFMKIPLSTDSEKVSVPNRCQPLNRELRSRIDDDHHDR
jgi:hypothetical protein